MYTGRINNPICMGRDQTKFQPEMRRHRKGIKEDENTEISNNNGTVLKVLCIRKKTHREGGPRGRSSENKRNRGGTD